MFISAFKGFTEGIVYASIITIVMAVFFTYAPDLEFKYMPVLVSFKAEQISQTELYRVYNVSFDKRRTCEIDMTSVSWYFMNDTNELERVQVILPPRLGDPTRPTGLNVSKAWKVYIPASVQPRFQKFVVYHYCHPGWRSRTEIAINNK